MKLGVIGLGKMGAAIGDRLVEHGHEVVGFDVNELPVRRLEGNGGNGARSLEEFLERLAPPRIIWLMLPSEDEVDRTLDNLQPRLAPRDIVIDGGNSFYKRSQERARRLAGSGIEFLDVGTSGGVWGGAEGYCLMIGGEPAAVESLRPLLDSLAWEGPKGWARVGPSGAGHFVKMVHNGIEYGLMQAYAEGFSLLAKKEEFGLDLEQVSDLWRRGSVVRSWLLDLISRILGSKRSLQDVESWVPDSGQGRWTVLESIELATPVPVITAALLERFASRQEDAFGPKLLSLLRHEFGGHSVRRSPDLRVEAGDGQSAAESGAPEPQELEPVRSDR